MDVFESLTELAAARLRASALAPFAQPFWDRLSEQRTDRKFNRMRPSMARVLGLETRSAKAG